MPISLDTKDEIISGSDIIEIIGEVVELNRRGSNFLGLCPFHQERTPSFTVSPEKGIYKCFGCGKSGNVISFMLDYHGLSYPEALRELARRAGITIIEEKTTPKERQQLSKKELVLESLRQASDFYFGLLFTNAGGSANQYFIKRGFSKDLIREFKLGYSPDSWDETKIILMKKGFSEEILLEAGLIIHNEERDSSYDRFRARAMFPIYDYMGHTIAFGARSLKKEDDGAKYINSPQTIVYDKSRTLYGLYQAKNEIRTKKYAILAEGYADVLSLHLAGFKNAVASSGTALTREQLELLSRFTNKLYISYDSDFAGIAAAEKGLELAVVKGFEVNIIQLPQGEDPDSIIQKYGTKAYHAQLEKSLSFLDFKIERLKETGKLESPKGKSDSIREIIALISKIPDRMQHDFFLSKMASSLGLSEYQIRKVYDDKKDYESRERTKITQDRTNEYNEEKSKTTTQSGGGDFDNKAMQSFNTNTDLPFNMIWDEFFLFHLALKYEDIIPKTRKIFKNNENNIVTDTAKRFLKIIWDFSEKSNNLINSIVESEEINENDKEILSYIALNQEQPSENWLKYTDDNPGINVKQTLRYLELKIKLHKIDNNRLLYKNQLQNASSEEGIEILREIRELDKTRLNIKKKLEELKFTKAFN
jgi:DNA primase